MKKLLAEAKKAAAKGDEERSYALTHEAGQALADVGRAIEAIDLFSAAGDFHSAAALSSQFVDHSRTARLWFRAGEFVHAAEIYYRQRDDAKAADLFQRGGAYDKAAAIYEQRGDFVRAADNYERGGDKGSAAELLRRAIVGDGVHQIVGRQAQEVCRRAAVMLVDCDKIEEAVELLQFGRQIVFAAKLLTEVGRHGEAADLLETAGELRLAAEVCRKAGQEHRANLLLARRSEMEGRLTTAAAHFEEAEAFAEAARCYELAGDLVRAAGACERQGEFGAAAGLYERLGQKTEAERCYRAAGMASELEALQARTGRKEGSIRDMEMAGELLNAASSLAVLARQGQTEHYAEAITLLSRLNPSSPNYLEARTLLAELHEERGDHRQAWQVLHDVLQVEHHTIDHVPALFQFGRILEREGYLAEARRAFRTAARLDPKYRGVGDRVKLAGSTQVDMAVPPTVLEAARRALDQQRAAKKTAPSTTSQTMQALSVDGVMVEVEDQGPLADEVDKVDKVEPAPVAPLEAPIIPGVVMSAPPLPPPMAPPSFPEPKPIERPLAPPPSPPPPPAESPETMVDDHLLPEKKDAVGMVLRGRFRIERKLGSGSQATVYLARDMVLDRTVAIKILDAESAKGAGLELFLKEARTAAKVHHPNCVAVYDFGTERGYTFMAMEHVDGSTLTQHMKGPMPSREALRIAVDIAAALGAIHARGIVHRDVKPNNIMVTRAKEVRLTDFGVARNLDDVASSGLMVGTMSYMSPEQAKGRGVDHRADIFSFGVLLYEMVAGAKPFGRGLNALIARADKPPPPLPEAVKAPQILQEILEKCMQPLPDDRYDTVSDLVPDLKKAVKVTRRDERENIDDSDPSLDLDIIDDSRDLDQPEDPR